MGLKEWFQNYTQTHTATKIQPKFKVGDMVELMTIPKTYAIVCDEPIDGVFGKLYKCRYVGHTRYSSTQHGDSYCVTQEQNMFKLDLKSET